MKKKILYVQYANPAAFPPVLHSANLFAEKSWTVFFLGSHSRGVETLDIKPHPSIGWKIRPSVGPGWRQKIAYFVFTLKAINKGIFWPADCIYISDNLAAPAGWALRNVFRKVVVYHEHDDPSQERESVFFRVVKWFRKSLARSASAVVIPQHSRLKLFLEETGSKRPSYCVWNCPGRAEAHGGSNQLRQKNQPLSVYFHGSINLNMVPLELIEASGRSGVPVRLRIVGYETGGSKGASKKLQEAAALFSDSLKLEIMGPLSRSQLIDAMNGMHVGWVNFPTDCYYHNTVMRHLAGASNKAFDYLAAGLALIFPEDQEWKEIYSEYGKSCDSRDVEGIANLLKWFYDHPEETYRMGQSGQRKIQEEWNYEAQFEPVFRHIEKLVSTR